MIWELWNFAHQALCGFASPCRTLGAKLKLLSSVYASRLSLSSESNRGLVDASSSMTIPPEPYYSSHNRLARASTHREAKEVAVEKELRIRLHPFVVEALWRFSGVLMNFQARPPASPGNTFYSLPFSLILCVYNSPAKLMDLASSAHWTLPASYAVRFRLHLAILALYGFVLVLASLSLCDAAQCMPYTLVRKIARLLRVP
jgi:hypothetical protein